MSLLKDIGKKNSSEHLNTIVGDGTMVSGELAVSGSARIDGRFSGKFSTTGHLTVGQGGSIEATDTVHCQSANIAGTIIGDITAPQRVHLARTAKVNGNITTQALIIEEGATFNGKCNMSYFDAKGEAET